MLHVFLVVLIELDPQECCPKDHGDNQKQDKHPAVAHLSFVYRHSHRQAAAKEHACVDCAQNDVEMAAGFPISCWIHSAVNRVSEEEPAKKQNLRGEEEPHTHGGRFLLLFVIVKLMRDCQFHSYKQAPLRMVSLRNYRLEGATALATRVRWIPTDFLAPALRIEGTRRDKPSAEHIR